MTIWLKLADFKEVTNSSNSMEIISNNIIKNMKNLLLIVLT